MHLPFYYIKNDPNKEKLGTVFFPMNPLNPLSRLNIAIYFAEKKRLPLKEFLKIYSISK